MIHNTSNNKLSTIQPFTGHGHVWMVTQINHVYIPAEGDSEKETNRDLDF